MALRVTAQYIDVVVSDAEIKGFRVEAQNVEVGGNVDLNPSLRIEAQNAEVGGSIIIDGNIRVEAQNAEVGGEVDLGTQLRLSTFYIEALIPNDHRGLTGILGTIKSGLATETLQWGAGAQGPSKFSPVNTGRLGSRSSLLGGHLQPGDPIHAMMMLNLEASSTISASQSADGDVSIMRSAESTIALSQSDNVEKVLCQFATSTLSLTSEARHAMRNVSANNTIVVSQSASMPNMHMGNAESVLSLTQVADSTDSIDIEANSVISLTDGGDYTIDEFGLTASSQIELSQNVNTNIKYLDAVTPDPQSDPIDSIPNFTSVWSQSARLAETFEISASNNISLSQNSPQPTGKRSYFASNSLTINSFADTSEKFRNLVTTIDITQTAVVSKVTMASNLIALTQAAFVGFIPLSASSTIVLTQFARSNPIEVEASNNLDLGQGTRSSIFSLDATSTIDLSDSVGGGRPYHLLAQNPIIEVSQDFDLASGQIIETVISNIEGTADYLIDANRSASSIIPIVDTASVTHIKATAIDLDAENTLSMGVDAITNVTGDAESTIVLTHNADWFQSEDGVSSLSLEQEAIVKIKSTIAAISNIVLAQSVSVSFVNNRTECEYSNSAVTRLSDVYADIPETIRFRLAAIPFEDGETTDTIDLRAPDFGNRERVQDTRINRQSVGGSLQVYADPDWPKLTNLLMQFSGLKETTAHNLLDFLDRTCGREIGVLDYERRIWRALVTNPDSAITQDGRDSFSVTLEMEAELIRQFNASSHSQLIVSGQSGGTL